MATMFAGHKTLDEINLMVLKLQNWLAQKTFFDLPLALKVKLCFKKVAQKSALKTNKSVPAVTLKYSIVLQKN